jgi:hypothetical protein
MSDLPQVAVTEFKKLTAKQIKEMKSFDVIADGVYLCTVSIPRTDYIKTTVNEMSILSNAVGGKDPDVV